VVFTLAVILAFFAMIYSRISLDRTAFELQGIESELATQERIHWDLRLELARLQDPRRITEAAAGLGLVFPEERIPIEAPGVQAARGDGQVRWTASHPLLFELP
jgi:cell division protein FtsL